MKKKAKTLQDVLCKSDTVTIHNKFNPITPPHIRITAPVRIPLVLYHRLVSASPLLSLVYDLGYRPLVPVVSYPEYQFQSGQVLTSPLQPHPYYWAQPWRFLELRKSHHPLLAIDLEQLAKSRLSFPPPSYQTSSMSLLLSKSPGFPG